MADRPVAPEAKSEDEKVQQSLRPTSWDGYFGQALLKENIQILIEAAVKRDDAVDHILAYGPPGLGKTTLAGIVAQEMDVNLKVTSGPAIERPGDLAAILTNLRKGDILFIDEIHRMSRAVEEVLYPAMEDFSLDIIIGKGSSARNIRLKLPRFSILGATTNLSLLASPLRDRFGSIFRLEFYSPEDLQKIIMRSAEILGVRIEPEGAAELAVRARGTARIANRLLRRARDYAEVRGDGIITREIADAALELMKVDAVGLDDLDRKVLDAIIDKFSGGPVGLETIAASISEEGRTIMDVVEPYLLQLGFLERTPRGRKATARAYIHMGYEPPEPHLEQSSLF